MCYVVSPSLRLLGTAPGHPGRHAVRTPCVCAARLMEKAAGDAQGALGQLEALCVEAVALLAGHGLQQGMLLLQAAG